jgi:hypothetical protein
LYRRASGVASQLRAAWVVLGWGLSAGVEMWSTVAMVSSDVAAATRSEAYDLLFVAIAMLLRSGQAIASVARLSHDRKVLGGGPEGAL